MTGNEFGSQRVELPGQGILDVAKGFGRQDVYDAFGR